MKSVIIYTYFFSPSSNYNLAYFVKKELLLQKPKERSEIDYIIVINGFHYDESIVFPTNLSNLTILKRPNEGYDFGGHHFALEYLEENGNKNYDYYFFMNSGVIGPILPNYWNLLQPSIHWSSLFIRKITDVVKVVGTTIVCLPFYDAGGFGPKVEGFFFMTDAIGLAVLQQEGTIFRNHATKYDAIVQGEYGVSRAIFKHGYSIDCMLPKYQNIDWRDPKNHIHNQLQHPSRKGTYFGRSIQPYEVIFHKWFWHGEETVQFETIQDYVAESG
jgi:hypothetical protein